MGNVTIDLGNGMTVTGPVDEIGRLLGDEAYRLNEGAYYFSVSKGRHLLIHEMASPHIKNAMLKIIGDTTTRLRATHTAKGFVDQFNAGLVNNPTLISMAKVLEERSRTAPGHAFSDKIRKYRGW